MSDLDKNIHRKNDSSPYEKIIVNPIERERREKEKGYAGFKNSARAQIFAALISHFKKIISVFAPKGKLQGSLYNQSHLLENVAAFRELLLTLAREDLSHDPNFTEQLTGLWHNLLDDCNSVPLFEESSSEIIGKVNFFILQIKNFPPGADHTLGYYFDEYAGRDWTPFPFMQLLQGLHEEYQASPVISVLQNWILLLDDILLSGGVKLE